MPVTFSDFLTVTPIQTPPPTGYDLIAQGNYAQFIGQYGIQSVCIFIVALLGFHALRLYLDGYFDEQKKKRGKPE